MFFHTKEFSGKEPLLPTGAIQYLESFHSLLFMFFCNIWFYWKKIKINLCIKTDWKFWGDQNLQFCTTAEQSLCVFCPNQQHWRDICIFWAAALIFLGELLKNQEEKSPTAWQENQHLGDFSHDIRMCKFFFFPLCREEM